MSFRPNPREIRDPRNGDKSFRKVGNKGSFDENDYKNMQNSSHPIMFFEYSPHYDYMDSISI